jgi:hypothetical protein
MPGVSFGDRSWNRFTILPLASMASHIPRSSILLSVFWRGMFTAVDFTNALVERKRQSKSTVDGA